MHVCFGWCLSFLDIKDAFLLVPQRECVLVSVPTWWKPEEQVPGVDCFWVLDRVLPGQRNGAARFFDFLAQHLQALEFENTPLLPSLFRHRTRQLVLCSHVDDLILCGEKPDFLWLMEVGYSTQRSTFGSMNGKAYATSQSWSSTCDPLLGWHKSYAMLLPYKVFGSKLDSIHGRDGTEEPCEKVEVFTDSDWAGDQSSSTTRRRLSVSSAVIFLNGRPVTSWSRSQRSIALSSCESEYLSAVGGAAKGLYIGRLWKFLTRKEVAVSTVTDSSSCRAFSQRQGVGRLKHIDAKFLWVQQRLKEGAMAMEGVPTLLNVADMGTKRLRRAFLMYLMGMVQYDEASDSYVAVGELEFAGELRRRTMAKNMKSVKKVMMSTLVDSAEVGNPVTSTNLVKLVTLMAMQPMANGLEMDQVELQATEAKDSIYEIFGQAFAKTADGMDDWDPLSQELRQFRVHERPQDADSGEEYFRETPTGLARSRTKVANHAENEEADAEVQTDISLVNTPTFPAALSEKSGDVPDLPMVGLDLHDINVLLAHFPPGQRKRAERIREVSLFSEQMTRTAVDDCQWLKCDATKVLHCAALCLTQLLFADDLKMVAAGEDKYDRIWYMLMLWLMLGTPCRWPKFRGEVCLQFVGLDYCKFEVGLSERRTNWIVQWVETARQNGGSFLWADPKKSRWFSFEVGSRPRQVTLEAGTDNLATEHITRLRWRPGETNEEADDLTNLKFDRFYPHPRHEVSWKTLDWSMMDELLKLRFNILNLLLFGLLACVLRSGINFVNGPVTQRNVSVSAAAQGYFPVGNAKQTAPYGERDPLPEGYGIRTGLSDLLKPLNAEAGVVAKEDSIPTILVMLTGIVLLILFYLLLLLIDNQSVLLPPEDEFDEYVANFLPYFFFGEK
ncbi:unnamed protein product [Cladocopium goreaui]|uniref:Copia protein (Gag-int-pol protein) [Cleaved into: Copia VLP protein Copia protease ] n=1 Tax=Cladocopium goreaui TaxID=2562237 RepID=A0A9P1FFB5_9DINO|nr:unnamed protein product [Cladocopium goreaui]